MKFDPQEFSVTFKTGGDLTMGMSLINTYAFFLIPWTLHLLFINVKLLRKHSVSTICGYLKNVHLLQSFGSLIVAACGKGPHII